MKKHVLLFAFLIAIGLTSFAKKTNVLVVVADDVGIGDISAYRRLHSQDIKLETPNIDALASAGMMFTDGHSPTSLCAPSRYSLMTGNYTYRSDFPWGVWGSYEKSPLKEDGLTLGKLMQQANYKTAFFGKWHLGGDYSRKDNNSMIYRGPRYKPELDVDITRIVGGGPQQNGFDYSYTFPAGIQDVPYAAFENGVWEPFYSDSEVGFITQKKMDEIGVKLDKMEGLGDTRWNPQEMGGRLVNKAVDFIQSSGKEPFFMYYCSQAVHLPHTPPESLNGVPIRGTTPSAHMDMIKELDVQVGMLVDALKKKGVYKNTLIVFTSDNGGLQRKETIASGHKSCSIYRGGKNQVYEGGHRVPFFFSFPGKIKAGSKNNSLISGVDLMNTLAALTGQSLQKGQALDSYNLLPMLYGQQTTGGHKVMMLQAGTSREVVLRDNELKLIMSMEKKTDEIRPTKLFNLKNNEREQEAQNLIDLPQYKKTVKRMHTEYMRIRENKVQTR